MDTPNLQLTPEQQAAIVAHADQPLYIEDAETRETYLLVKAGKFPELEEEYVRARLEDGFAAVERGEEEASDSPSIKTEGRRVLRHCSNAAAPSAPPREISVRASTLRD